MSRNSREYTCVLQIENFPSRYEIFKSLDTFLAERHLSVEYESINKDKKINLIFKDSSVPIEFSKVLQAKKDTLPFYSQITTKISIDLPNGALIKNSNNPSPTTSNNKARSNSQAYVNYPSQLLPNSKRDSYHIESIKKVVSKPAVIFLANGKAYSSILPRGRSLRNSIPFIEKEKLEYLDHLSEKGKWLDEKGFDINVKLAHSGRRSEIPNYVQNTPPKYPVHLHQFRDVNRNKWISRDFTFKGNMIYLSH